MSRCGPTRPIVASRPIPRIRSAILGVVLPVCIAASGCVTTLGYVPEHLKPSDTTSYVPTYPEVKKWAYDVVDGYDSRATMNRQAVYVAALFGAAAAGAIAGLAAFAADRSALIGIPIGTSFLAGVAAIYSSEDKSRIYSLASRFVKELITVSDERLRRREIATQQIDEALSQALEAATVARQHLTQAMEAEKVQKEEAKAARQKADAEADPIRKKQFAESAQALEALVAKATGEVAKAQAARDAAERRVESLKRLKDAWAKRTDARVALAVVAHAAAAQDAAALARAQVEAEAAEEAWKGLSNPQKAEALCLRNDVNDVMRRVGEHIALLDPKNVVDRLRALAATASPKGEAETTAAKFPPADLSDLDFPVKSRCEGAI